MISQPLPTSHDAADLAYVTHTLGSELVELLGIKDRVRVVTIIFEDNDAQVWVGDPDRYFEQPMVRAAAMAYILHEVRPSFVDAVAMALLGPPPPTFNLQEGDG